MTPPRPYLCFCPACGCPGIVSLRSGNSFHAWLSTDGYYSGPMMPKEKPLYLHPVCQHYIWQDEVHFERPETLTLKAYSAGVPGITPCQPHKSYLQAQEDPIWWEITTWPLKHEPRSSFYWREEHQELQNILLALCDLAPETDIDFYLDPIQDAEAWEMAWQLGVAGHKAEHKRFLLRRWWWSLNHVFGDYDPVTDEYIEPPPVDQDVLTRCLEALLPLLKSPKHRIDRAEALRELGRFDEAALVYREIDTARLSKFECMRFQMIGPLIEARSCEIDSAEPEGFTMFL